MECFFPSCVDDDIVKLRRHAAAAEAECAKLREQIEHLHDHALSSGDAHARAAAKAALATTKSTPVGHAAGAHAEGTDATGSAHVPAAAHAVSSWGRLRKASLHTKLEKDHPHGFAGLIAGGGLASGGNGGVAPGGNDSDGTSSSSGAAERSAPVPTTARHKIGEVRGVNGMNQALWALGAFAHEPPTFAYFEPSLTASLAVDIREVRLPRATETHELCYEPKTRCVFCSQMSNSVLVRIPVGDDGLLLNEQDAWHVGPVDSSGDGLGGLHNLSLSAAHEGCVWISLQFLNEILLVDAATMAIRRILKVPTLLVRPRDKTAVRVGGPHCVRECGETGTIW